MADETLKQEEFSPQEKSYDDNNNSITTNKKSKDSVFVNLFNDHNYVLQLYKELHPEDTKVTLNNINVTTLKSVLVNTIYNDLGFIVTEGEESKLVMLVESQSTWNPNMTLRMLFYLSQTYLDFLRQSKQSEHSNSRVKLPKPELYVVYSGDRKVPDEISFKDDYFHGNSPLDLKVKILSKIDTTIYGQYIGFCKVYNEQRKIYDNSLDCAKETIRICLERGYLTDFLLEHRKEVFTMMSELFDEQAQREAYNEAMKKEFKAEGRAEGIEIGEKNGEKKGKLEGKLDVALNLLSLGTVSIEDIAKVTGFTLERIKELAAQDKTVTA